MPKPPRAWDVRSHGPLVRLDENLWCIEGDVPGIPGLTRRMSVVRRSDGRLLFYNAVPVADAALADLRALGAPAQLVVPQHLHTRDAQPFRERLGVRVYAPAATRERVAREVQVDGTFEELPPDPCVEVVSLDGFSSAEGVMLVRSGSRASLLVGDAVLNVPRGPGLPGLVFHVLGMTGDRPRLPLPVKLRVVRDRRAARAHLERLAETPGLARVVPTHGPVIDRDAAAALRAVAATV